jgi:predicted lipoprotein
MMEIAGADSNFRFQSPREAQRALHTALSKVLEFLHDQRLGRQFGTFDRPRPNRAEARRSGRSLRHVRLSLEALEELALLLARDDPSATRAAFAAARDPAGDIDNPAL